MQEVILIAHLSLDGFVADDNGSLNLFKAGEDNLQFVTGISKTTDTILVGRNTYNMMDDYWTKAKDLPNATKAQIEYSNWYNLANKVVVSRTMPEAKNSKTRIINNNIVESVSSMKENKGTGIVIFTSPPLTQLLMQYKLIDTYWLFFNPLFLGKGVQMFKNSPTDTNFKLCETRQFENEEIALKYTKTI
ncbi:MAG: dihydrofolate reductase family protein [Rhabdochlamydiaceae bacterium]